MPEYFTVIAENGDLKVSLISGNTSSSVPHQFCCGAVMFWFVPSPLVSLIFHNCLHFLLNTRPLVEKILLHILLSSPDLGPPGGDQWGRPLSPYPHCAAPQRIERWLISSLQLVHHLPKPPPHASDPRPTAHTCNHHLNLPVSMQTLWQRGWNAVRHKLGVVVGQYSLIPEKSHYGAEPQRSGWLSYDDI